MWELLRKRRGTEMTTQSWNALPTRVLEIHYLSCATKLSLSVIFFHSCFSLKALLSFPNHKDIYYVGQSRWLVLTEEKMPVSLLLSHT